MVLGTFQDIKRGFRGYLEGAFHKISGVLQGVSEAFQWLPRVFRQGAVTH